MSTSVSLVEVSNRSFVLTVDGHEFAATANADAVGCIAWAFGVEHLFGAHYPDSDTWRWIAWHWCAILTYKKAGLAPPEPEDDIFFDGTLEDACELAPSVEVADKLRRRYRERVAAIEEKRAQGRYDDQALELPGVMLARVIATEDGTCDRDVDAGEKPGQGAASSGEPLGGDDGAFLAAITSSGNFTLAEAMNMYGHVDEQTARELARAFFGQPQKQLVDEPLLSSDGDVMAGRVCFAGTRVPIEIGLASIDAGVSWDRVLNAYPFMTQAHVDAARRHLAARDAQLQDDALSALRGLEDFAAGRFLSEDELDDALGLKREPWEGK